MPSASDDADGAAGDEDQRVPERLPEHVVVEQHLLVVVEPGQSRRAHRRPLLERQHSVPDQREDAVEEEDRERGREEAPDQHGLSRPLPSAPRATPAAAHAFTRASRSATRSRPRLRRGAVPGRPCARPRPAPPWRLAAEQRALQLRPERLLDAARRAAVGQLPTCLSVSSSCVCSTAIRQRVVRLHYCKRRWSASTLPVRTLRAVAKLVRPLFAR